MSQLLQVRTITQVIDSRIAQFSSGTKELPTTVSTRTKVPNKLKPLDHAPSFKQPKADTSECRTPKVQLSPIPQPKTRNSLRSTTTTTSSLRRSDAPQPLQEESSSPMMEKVASSTSMVTFHIQEAKESQSTEHWTSLLSCVLESVSVPLSLTPGFQRLRRTVRSLKSAVRTIESKQRMFLIKRTAATVIQAWVRSYNAVRKYREALYAVVTIQRYWHNVYMQKKRFRRTVAACRLITAWWKLQFVRRSRSAVLIQKVYKGFRDRKKHGQVLKKRIAEAKHSRFMQQQAKKVEERNRRIAAVRTIERYWIKRQHRRNLSKIRKYLWTLPYECRLLYLKFKQVKADADMLKRDVETLIATKKSQANQED